MTSQDTHIQLSEQEKHILRAAGIFKGNDGWYYQSHPNPNVSTHAIKHQKQEDAKGNNPDTRKIVPLVDAYTQLPEHLRQQVTDKTAEPQYDQEPPIFGMDDDELNERPDFEQEEAQGSATEPPPHHKPSGFFRVASMNEWLTEASTMPIPKMLCDELWFESELCILFATTNQGKSVEAVQIGERIATGKSDKGFRVTTDPQRIIYFDFELTAKQVEARYSENYTNHYQFSPNFIRVEIDPDEAVPDGVPFSQYVINAMRNAIEKAGAKVVIVDNITFLNSNAEAAKEAGPFMIGLQQLKRQLSLSMLVIGHTPKIDPSRPITRNDLQGSSRLSQLADSMFAIAASTKDPAIKYFKQLKARFVPFRYETDNVIVCQLHQPTNFLRFDFLEYGNEQDHLKPVSDDERKGEETRVITLKDEGKTQTQIAQMLGMSQAKVSRILQKMTPGF